MGYRNIEVEGKKYEYVVGRKAVKIRGANGYLKIMPREDVGQPLGRMHVVTPFGIRQAILGLPSRRTFTCRKHGTVTQELAYVPFCAEVYGKYIMMMSCPECLETAKWTSKWASGRFQQAQVWNR